jgi:tungstate transport system substrate-binding protein
MFNRTVAWLIACLTITVGGWPAKWAIAEVSARADTSVVRVAVVNTPQFSGLMDALVADFQIATGQKVVVYSGSDVYDRARAGEADMVISHYGKAGAEQFVLDGFGSWPKTVFANQAVIAGPKSDPAGIRGLASAAEAMRRIAKARAPFVANALPGVTYMTEIIWEEAGRPDKTGWYLEAGASKGKAIELAEQKEAYVIWGALPFLRYKEKHSSDFEILVNSDPLLQRVMVSIIARPEKLPGTNTAGAEAFQHYLLSPRAQAKISAFRSMGFGQQLWWPAGRHNSNEGGGED